MIDFFKDIKNRLDEIQEYKNPNRKIETNKNIRQIKETMNNPNFKTSLNYNLVESFQNEKEFKEILKSYKFLPNQTKSFGHNGKTWTVTRKNGKYQVKIENEHKVLDNFEVTDA